SLQMNDIAECELETTHTLFLDRYVQNRTMGSFILIDSITNATVAAGMIREGSPSDEDRLDQRTAINRPSERNGHLPVAIWTIGETAKKFESACSLLGWRTQFIAVDEFTSTELSAIARLMRQAGAVVIYSAGGNSDGSHLQVLRELFEDRLLQDHALSEADMTAEEIAARLQAMSGTLRGEAD
ncbi:MAG TPA: hypothetical protein VJN64_15185, partial [Terriglobales bacterium]|nr:hypothetical protein [Terriglobales bacterium]